MPEPAHLAAAPSGGPASDFSYEVTFLLDATETAVSALRDELDLLGDSLVVSGRAPRWHVHIHVADAGAVIEAGLAAGRPSKITVTYLNQTRIGLPAGWPAPAGVVAIADGDGLVRLLGAAGAAVVDGTDPGAALEELAGGGGPAVLLRIRGRLAASWPREWPVLTVDSEVQLLAALAVHDPRRDQDADLATMRRAVAGMRWASVRRGQGAGRQDSPGGTEPFVGSLAGQAVVAGCEQAGAAFAVADLLLDADPEMLTLLTGEAASPGLARLVADHAAGRVPGVEVVCYDGGMTSSVLLIGAE